MTTLFVMCRNLGEHAQHTQNPHKKSSCVSHINTQSSFCVATGEKRIAVSSFFGSCISSRSYTLWWSCRIETVWCSALQLKTAFRQQWHHFHNATQRSSSKILTALLLYLRNESGAHYQQQLLVSSKHVMHAPKKHNSHLQFNDLGHNEWWMKTDMKYTYKLYIYAFSSCKMRTKKLLFAQVRHYTSTQVHLFPNRRKKKKEKKCKEVEKNKV